MRTLAWFTLFLGAFLLFQVELILAKALLPAVGGSATVWAVAMLFFQAVLLCAYAYAHLLTRIRSPRVQAQLHMALTACSCIVLAAVAATWRRPLLPPVTWRPADGADPTLWILAVLSASVGLPFFMLAATAPLLQRWSLYGSARRSPYSLYAVSNLGSLAGLLSYPFAVEPTLTLGLQAALWTGFYVVFCTGIAVCAYRLRVCAGPECSLETPRTTVSNGMPADASARILWFLLAACASIVMLAATHMLCTDIAPVPFLWVLPLALYLVSFIAAFSGRRGYIRAAAVPLLIVSMVAICFSLFQGAYWTLPPKLAAAGAFVFAACWFCHGELFRLRPPPEGLTDFYLVIASGGVAGGLVVGIAAPQLFSNYWELHASLVLCGALIMVVLLRDRRPSLYRGRTGALRVAMLGAWALLLFVVAAHVLYRMNTAVVSTRNFYGALVVREAEPSSPARHRTILRHGTCIHGIQFLDPELRRQPTAYYTEDSGIGLTLQHVKGVERPLRIGCIGLGAGAIAAYARDGDLYRFYEINPAVVALARDSGYFDYLRRSPARTEVVTGDGRLLLERDGAARGPMQFDVLAVDAFSGDAIPVHLLTAEAFELYIRHLAVPHGVLAVHITNSYLDLAPVVKAGAERLGMDVRFVRHQPTGEDPRTLASEWALAGRRGTLDWLTPGEGNRSARDVKSDSRHAWSDDYSNLLGVLR